MISAFVISEAQKKIFFKTTFLYFFSYQLFEKNSYIPEIFLNILLELKNI